MAKVIKLKRDNAAGLSAEDRAKLPECREIHWNAPLRDIDVVVVEDQVYVVVPQEIVQ